MSASANMQMSLSKVNQKERKRYLSFFRENQTTVVLFLFIFADNFFKFSSFYFTIYSSIESCRLNNNRQYTFNYFAVDQIKCSCFTIQGNIFQNACHILPLLHHHGHHNLTHTVQQDHGKKEHNIFSS